jgi:hypothetical protein
MAVRASVNQVVQLGAEATPGTAVAAGKLLSAFTWAFGDKSATKQLTATGRKYPSASELLTEYSAGKISGEGDFAALIYPVSSVYGKVTAVAHSPSVTAFDWIWTPPISGLTTNPQTYTVQNGDSIDAEQYAYLMFSGWGYSFTRKQEVQVAGDWFSQTFTDGITMTASPTNIAFLPMTGAQFKVYLDTTSAGLGTTLLTDPLKVDFKASNYFGQYWPINAANASFTSHLELLPKNELKLMLQANSTAIAIRGNYLQTGTRAYVRVTGTGATIDGANSIKAGMTHDLAVFVSEMAEFSDQDGVFAVEYTLQAAEDTGWTALAGGTAQKLTLTNLLSAL